jgi:uncharacterized membrane protein YccC
VDTPELLCTALAAWIGFCLYVSLLDRTPRSYVFRLAGYTAGLIAFPSVTQPDTLFLTALARTEEIGLGVVCAAVTHSLIFPQSLEPAVRQRIQSLGASAGSTGAATDRFQSNTSDGP